MSSTNSNLNEFKTVKYKKKYRQEAEKIVLPNANITDNTAEVNKTVILK